MDMEVSPLIYLLTEINGIVPLFFVTRISCLQRLLDPLSYALRVHPKISLLDRIILFT